MIRVKTHCRRLSLAAWSAYRRYLFVLSFRPWLNSAIYLKAPLARPSLSPTKPQIAYNAPYYVGVIAGLVVAFVL